MIIDCISDLHGHYPTLDGGDLLIVAGDLTARHTEPEFFECFDWIHRQNYRKKILVAGNHDTRMQEENYRGPEGPVKDSFDYLCDSGIEFEGLKIWGSPWTKWFKGINPKCTAFTLKIEQELFKKWQLIPEETDILITHSPPFGVLDKVRGGVSYDEFGNECHEDDRYCGSRTLWSALFHKKALKLHVFGHIHEGYGSEHRAYVSESFDDPNPKPIGYLSVNASHMNERYEPVNKPIRVII